MSPPLSRMERDHPPPRRKSCQACVKTKRRCDQRYPTCLRCSQRKIQCQYPPRPSRHFQAERAQSPLSTGVRTTAQPENQRESAGQDETLLNATVMAQDIQFFESPWPGDEAYSLQVDEVALGAAEGLPLSSQFVATWDSTLAGQANVLPGADKQNDMGYLFDFAEAGASSRTMDLAARAPLQFSAPRRIDVAALTNELESKLSYAIDRIKAAPRTMLLETETPWCHPLLYREQMPRVMQGELTCVWCPSSGPRSWTQGGNRDKHTVQH